MEIRHVQGELRLPEYEALREVVAQEGQSMKDAVREAIIEWVTKKRRRADPIHDLVGIAKGPAHAAAEHDAIYDED